MFSEFSITDGPVPLHISAGPANGPPLVMWHGVGRRGLDFLPLVPALATRWHLHLVDQRGHGGSGRAAGKYLAIDHLDDALTVINWLGRPAVHLGHSLGALVAASAAATRPELVLALILEDPPSAAFLAMLSNTPYHPTFEVMRRLAGHHRNIFEVARELGETIVPTSAGPATLASFRDAASLRFMARCLSDVDGDVFSPAIKGGWLEGYDERAIWKRITCPTLLLRGDPSAGGMLPGDDADNMSNDISELTRIDFKGIGHLIHGIATEQAARHVINFLESL